MSQIPVNLPGFTDAEEATLRTSFDAIKAVLVAKFINLEPEDRRAYGSINELNKLIVIKAKDYHDNQPALSDPKVDWLAYDKNFITRKNYELVEQMTNEILELCGDPRTLVDYVLYGMARKDYRWTKYNAEEDGGGAAGYEAKYNDMKQFFAKDGGGSGTGGGGATPNP